MRRFLIVAALLAATISAKKPRWHELKGYTFEQYVQDFKKPYGPKEDRFHLRKKVFNENIANIHAMNADPTATWKAGVNMFTDMTPQEFKAYNRFKKGNKRSTATVVHDKSWFKVATEPLPLTVDWRVSNPRVLTAVKHQGSCGSCWAHSATESMEAQYALLTGMLPVLSVAQINSCTPGDYNCAGCDGGDYVGAWEYLANTTIVRSPVLQALTEQWAYPMPVKDWFYDTQVNYSTSACFDVSQEWQTPTSQWFAELTAAGVKGYGVVNSNEASGGPLAQKALRDIGPQSVSVAAGNWQWYETGIFQNTNSSGGDNEWGIDHAVQMVGYGYDAGYGLNYWVVRNSWSTLWGEQGYIRLFRAADGADEPCSPDEYGPVCGTSGVLSDLAYPIVYEHTPTKFG